MKTTIKWLIVLALALVTFGQPTTARANGAVVSFGKGPHAYAQFGTSSGCIESAVFVSVADRKIKQLSGSVTSDSWASVTILQYNRCEYELLFYASGYTLPLSNEEFQISTQLDSARLNTTVDLFEVVSGTSFDVDVDISWIGVGPITHVHDNNHIQDVGCIINTRFEGKSRTVEALGTVSDGTTNFTSEPAVLARLSSLNSGRVAINCPDEE